MFWVGFFFSLSYSHSDSQSGAADQIYCSTLSGENISVGISASAGFEQANGELQPELSKVQVKNRILPSTEPEAGQKRDQTAIAPCCCQGWALLVFSQPPVCHVPSPLEAFLGGRNAAEHLSAGDCSGAQARAGIMDPETSTGCENTPSVNLSNILILQMSMATSAKG